jgi:YVTN family beta-propeller protein
MTDAKEQCSEAVIILDNRSPEGLLFCGEWLSLGEMTGGRMGLKRVMEWSLLLAALGVVRAGAQVGDEPATTLINRGAIVYSKSLDKMYVVDQLHDAVLAVRANGAVKRVKIGGTPDAIAVNDRTGMVYVASPDGKSASVIDGRSDAVVATLPMEGLPYAIAVDELANKVYVASTYSNMLAVIDGTTNAVSKVKTGSADAVVVDAARKQIYLMGYESNTITVVKQATGEIAKIPAGEMHLWGVALDGGTLLVTHVQGATVEAIDVDSGSSTTIATGAMPCAVAVNPSTGLAYVANYGDGSVTAVDVRRGVAVGTVKVGKHPEGIAVDPASGLVYVVNTGDATVSEIEEKNLRVVKTMKAGEHPYAVAVNAKDRTVYIANLGQGTFTVLGR